MIDATRTVSPPNTRHTTLYRLHDGDGRLLYIGIAHNPGKRFEQHAGDKGWWTDVATITLEHFTDRDRASAEEAIAIRAERPAYNVVHNGQGRIDTSTLPERPDWVRTDPSSFTRWLRTQRKRGDSIGALAQDMHGDSDWPADSDLETIETYLMEVAGIEAADALCLAWGVWTCGEHEPTIPDRIPCTRERLWTTHSHQVSIFTIIDYDCSDAHIKTEAADEINIRAERNITRLRDAGWTGTITHGSGPNLGALPCFTSEAPDELRWLEQTLEANLVRHRCAR